MIKFIYFYHILYIFKNFKLQKFKIISKKKLQYDFPFVFRVFFKTTQFIFYDSKTIFYEFFGKLQLKIPVID